MRLGGERWQVLGNSFSDPHGLLPGPAYIDAAGAEAYVVMDNTAERVGGVTQLLTSDLGAKRVVTDNLMQ